MPLSNGEEIVFVGWVKRSKWKTINRVNNKGDRLQVRGTTKAFGLREDYRLGYPLN